MVLENHGVPSDSDLLAQCRSAHQKVISVVHMSLHPVLGTLSCCKRVFIHKTSLPGAALLQATESRVKRRIFMGKTDQNGHWWLPEGGSSRAEEPRRIVETLITQIWVFPGLWWSWWVLPTQRFCDSKFYPCLEKPLQGSETPWSLQFSHCKHAQSRAGARAGVRTGQGLSPLKISLRK